MIYAITVVLILIADQAVKFWTTKSIPLNAIGADCVKLIDGVVHMTNVHNYGAAFGIFQNARWPLTIISAVFVIVIIVLINKEIIHTKFGRWTAVLIVAGALGNCIDRLLYGYVVDMFEVEFFNFAVFNVADIFITVSGLLFCIHLIFHNEPEAVKRANEPEFMRRRREEIEAKETPRANIPKRGEHRTPEEELGVRDGEDVFSEDMEFGALVDDLMEQRHAGKQEPAPVREAERTPAPEPEPAPAYEPEPRKEPAAEEPEEPLDYLDPEEIEYSLDDILREFGDL